MRTAEDIVRDYRNRGYNEDRLRALANGRPEPMRSQILALLAENTAPPTTTEDPVAAAVEAIMATVTDATQSAADEIPTLESGALPGEAEDGGPPAAEPGEIILAFDESETADPGAEPEPAMVAASRQQDYDVLGVGCEEVFPLSLAAVEPPVSLDFEEDDEVAAATGDPGDPAAVQARVESRLPLAEIEVECLTQSEFFALPQEAPPALTAEVINLGAEDGALPAETGIQGKGEVWPAPTAAAETGAGKNSIFSHELFAELDEEILADLKKSKKFRRSLEVLENTLAAVPEIAATEAVPDNIICFEAPYAVHPENEGEDIMAATDESVARAKEESGLIKFPAEMMESYAAILSTRESDKNSDSEGGEAAGESRVAENYAAEVALAEEGAAANAPDVTVKEFAAAVTTDEPLAEQELVARGGGGATSRFCRR